MQLDIYIDDNCETCEEARRLAEQVRRRYPEIQVSVLDLTEPHVQKPIEVFAVPTYLLDGDTLFLGNPAEAEILETLAATLA